MELKGKDTLCPELPGDEDLSRPDPCVSALKGG